MARSGLCAIWEGTVGRAAWLGSHCEDTVLYCTVLDIVSVTVHIFGPMYPSYGYLALAKSPKYTDWWYTYPSEKYEGQWEG